MQISSDLHELWERLAVPVIRYRQSLHVTSNLKSRPATQSERVLIALQSPMTINELYQALPDISPDNIAPLVANHRIKGRVNPVGERRSHTATGVYKNQTVWSARQEDKPKDLTASFAMLDRIFGIRAPSVLMASAQVHRCEDD